MSQATISIRTDADLKQDFERLCREIGMNMSTAFNVFMKKATRENRIPFDLTGDPEEEEELETTVPGRRLTKEELLERIEELDAGFGIEMTMEEFDALTEEMSKGPLGGPIYQEIERRRAEMLERKRAWEAERKLG